MANYDQQCYMCMQTDARSELISPCVCKNDSAPRVVHRHCLDKWRRNTHDPRYFTHCRECGFKFRYVQTTRRAEAETDSRARRRQVVGSFFGHSALALVGSQCFLFVLAMFVRVCDSKEELVKFWNFAQLEGSPPPGDGSVQEALRYHKITYYVSACVVALALLGVFGLVAGIARCCAGCCSSGGSGSGRQGTREVFTAAPVFHSDPLTTYLCCRGCGDCCVTCGDCCICDGDICGRACAEDCGRCDGCGECGNCRDCFGGNSSSSGGGGDVMLVLMAVVVVALVFIGLVVVFVVVLTFIQRWWAKYVQALEMKSLTEEYQVEDLTQFLMNPPVAASAPVPVAPSAPVPVAVSPWQQDMDQVLVVQGVVIPAASPQVQLIQAQAFRAVSTVQGVVPDRNPQFPMDPESFAPAPQV